MGKVVQLQGLVQQALQAPPARQPERALMRTPHGAYPAELVPAGLPPAVNTAALLLCNPEATPVLSMNTNQLTRELFKPVEVVPFLLGHSQTLLTGADLLAMCTAVAEMVQMQFPALTMPEIALAFRRGCSGEWQRPDERLLPTLPTFRSWLKSYSEGSRARAVQALQLAEHQQRQLSLPIPNLQAGYPARVAAIVGTMRAAGRGLARVPDGQRPGPGPYQLPAKADDGLVLFAWLRKIGALPVHFGGTLQILRKEGLAICRERPRTPAHRSFAVGLRTGLPGEHPLIGRYRANCQRRQLRQWLIYHAAAGTDMQAWLQRLAEQQPSPTK